MTTGMAGAGSRGPDERGFVMIVAALTMTVVVIAASFAIDLGFQAEQKRQDHLVADLAALDAARALSSDATAAQAASDSAARNGYTPTTPGYVPFIPHNGTISRGHIDVATGVFRQGPASNGTYTAVRTTVNSTAKDFFAPSSHAEVATAVATIDAVGQFQIGSSLVSVSTPQSLILNSLLSPFGISSNLDAVGYQGLLSTNTTLGVLASALSLSALTPDQALATNITVAKLLTAEASLLPRGTPSQVELTALAGLVNATVLGNVAFTLGTLISIQPSTGAGTTSTVNLFNALVGSVEVADGTAAIDIPSLKLVLPGVGSVTAGVQAITPAVASVAGPAPQTATDTQVTVKLDVEVAGLMGLNPLQVSLPISIQAGGARGTMTAVCPPPTSPRSLSIDTVFQPADLTISPGGGPTAKVSVTLLGLGLAGATIAGGSNITPPPVPGRLLVEPLNFSYGANQPLFVGADLGLPATNLALTSPTGLVALLGGLPAILTAVHTLVDPVLATAETAIISPLLATFGVHIGAADLLGLMVSCASPRLAQ